MVMATAVAAVVMKSVDFKRTEAEGQWAAKALNVWVDGEDRGLQAVSD